MTPTNAFETHVGSFWGLMHTRDYMRARYALVREHLLPMGTLDGATESLEHLLDMLRLCRSDNLGLRDSAPTLMLRLDLDQECHDFVKWWATSYDNSDQSYLDAQTTDVFEHPNSFFSTYPDVNHLVAVLLLKLKLLVDIRNLKITRKVLSQRKIPVELWEGIELATIRSPLSVALQQLTPNRLREIEATLLNHATWLGSTINNENAHFIVNLLHPSNALESQVDSYSRRSLEEMIIALQRCYPAFRETAGVLDLLNAARLCASRDSEDEIPGIMESDTFQKSDRPGSRRTAKELLEDVSINRIWGYLDFAVMDAPYLGPPADRPSEREMRRMREELAASEAAYAKEMEEWDKSATDDDDEEDGDDNEDEDEDEDDDEFEIEGEDEDDDIDKQW
ncbi:hypothetical protein HDU87_001889 [Geranomyces variabilis]|uniref:Uncharacterized protein n=1 Tax=Geranomyces variabilis TaxID=109894 RepID=A0AAD5TGI5_9FUNG|nr:hypothetical protein HDU87_001889 [Geranomyces variabilis]